jgi:hypothetical protein
MDDTIRVFKTADKNSVRKNAKFIERKKQVNPYTNKYYSEKEFIVGNTIYIKNYTFKLHECDETSKHYMEDNEELFLDFDAHALLSRIKIAGLNQGS